MAGLIFGLLLLAWHGVAQDYDALDKAVQRLVEAAATSAAVETPRAAPSVPVAPVEPLMKEPPPESTSRQIPFLLREFWGTEFTQHNKECAVDLQFLPENGSATNGKVSIFMRYYKSGEKGVAIYRCDPAVWTMQGAESIAIHGTNIDGVYQIDASKEYLELKSRPGYFPPDRLKHRHVETNELLDESKRGVQK